MHARHLQLIKPPTSLSRPSACQEGGLAAAFQSMLSRYLDTKMLEIENCTFMLTDTSPCPLTGLEVA